MRIDIDVDKDQNGNIVATHFIETTDPIAHAVCVAVSGNAVELARQQWNIISKHPNANPGETRWAFFKRQLLTVPANDPLKLLNPV